MLLAAILMPALSKARQRAQAAVCISSLRQVAYLVFLYSDDYSGYLPASGWTFHWDETMLAANTIRDFNLTRRGCPTTRQSLAATYGYNYSQLGDDNLPTTFWRRLSEVEQP